MVTDAPNLLLCQAIISKIALSCSSTFQELFPYRCSTNGMRYGQVLSSFKKLHCIAFTKVMDCPGGVAAHLAGLPFLDEIHLHNCTALKDTNLFHLAKLVGLKHLNITTNQVAFCIQTP